MGAHMKTTVEISDALGERAKALARRQGRTLRDLIEHGLRLVLDSEAKTKRPFELRDASVGGQGLSEGLRYEDWGKILEMSQDRLINE